MVKNFSNCTATDKEVRDESVEMNRLQTLATLAVVVLATALAAGCGGAESGDADGSAGGSGDTVQVTATLPFIADMSREVGGDRVEVSSIVRPGDEVHTFQPSPSDAQGISESEVVFENGHGLEQWLDDLVESAGGEDKTVVALSEGLEPAEGEGHEEHSGEEGHGGEHSGEASHEEGEHAGEGGNAGEGGHTEEEHAEGEHTGEEGHAGEGHAGESGGAHDHGAVNPHFWLSVPNAEHYVEGVRDALIEADPESEDVYRQNAEEYLAELEELNSYVKEQVQNIPEENRKLVTFHDAFPYFAEEYGLGLTGVVLQNPNAEASSREVAELTRTVQEEDVPAIFTEPQFNSGLSDTIAQEAGVEVQPLYATFAQEGDIAEEDISSYERMMRTNVDNMVEGLG